MHPISVLFFMSNLKGGGAERVVLNLLDGFPSKDIQPSLFLLKNQINFVDEYNLLSKKVNIVFGINNDERLRNRLPEVWYKCNHIVKNSNILVGGLELDPTYFAFFWAKRFKKPVVGWIHTPIQQYLSKLPKKHSFFVRTIYPRLNLMIFPSQGAAASMAQYLNRSSDKIRVIPNPINLELIRNLANVPIPKGCTYINDRPVIISIGRLEVQKGFDLLIQASARLIDRGYDHTLIILGEGSQRQYLLDLASQLNISKKVFLPGFISNPFPLLKAAKIFVSASRVEGFGQAILEALALGVPVVATNCNTGPSEILDGGNFGKLVIPEDVIALTNAMEELFSPEENEKYSHLGYQRALNYSLDHIVNLWKETLFEVIQ